MSYSLVALTAIYIFHSQLSIHYGVQREHHMSLIMGLIRRSRLYMPQTIAVSIDAHCGTESCNCSQRHVSSRLSVPDHFPFPSAAGASLASANAATKKMDSNQRRRCSPSYSRPIDGLSSRSSSIHDITHVNDVVPVPVPKPPRVVRDLAREQAQWDHPKYRYEFLFHKGAGNVQCDWVMLSYINVLQKAITQ